jgi:pimeloyl-ACP methyl ester carboxylesterase
MSVSTQVRLRKSGGFLLIFQGIALLIFLFGCSQNPVSIDEPRQIITAAAPQTPIHQLLPPPASWNGDLVVYAHGFVPPVAPLMIPTEAAQYADMVMSAGYAFATTSYPVNGLAVPEGLADIVSLVNEYKAAYPATNKVLLIGFSMGGLIAAQAAEKYPGTFNGVLAMSGLYGNTVIGVSNTGTFRAVFDYFFPNLIPGDACSVPGQTVSDWMEVYMPQVIGALSAPANSDKVRQLVAVTKLPVDPADPASLVNATVMILTVHVFSTMDVIQRFGGNPFENRCVRYCGSDDDKALNAGIKRFRADKAAITTANTLYGTTGKLLMPVVTMHSTGDQLVPITQQLLYRIKVLLAGKAALYTGIPINGFGHGTFTPLQLQSAFAELTAKVTAASGKR